MIIPEPGRSLTRLRAGNRTVLPFARARRRLAPDEEGAQRRQQGAGRDRVDMAARALDHEAREDEFLQTALNDPEGDPSTLGERALGGFDARAQELFGGMADPAERATAFRKLGPARRRLEQRALALQRDVEDSAIADAIFRPAQTILTSPDRDAVRTGVLLDRLADVIETSSLPRERKDQVAAAIAARAMAEGREELLSRRFARFKKPARMLLEDGGPEADRADQSAADPAGTNVPPDGAERGTSMIAVPVLGRAPSGLGRLAPLVLAPLAPAVGTALLAAGLLSISSTPAGIPEIRRRVALDDGGAVDLFLGDTSGSLTMTGPAGEAVRLDIARGDGNRVIINGGSVSAADGTNRPMSRRELLAAFDALSGQADAIGLDIEMGGDEDEDGRARGIGDNNPPEPIDEPGDDDNGEDPDPERHPNIVAAGGVIAAVASNKHALNQDFLPDDIQRASEDLAEDILGPEPDSFDQPTLEHELSARVQDLRDKIGEIQGDRDIFNPTQDVIDAAQNLGGGTFEKFIRKTFGGNRGFSTSGDGTRAQLDGELPDGTWYEAKGAGAWQQMLQDKGALLNFRKQIGRQQKLARLNGKRHVLVTNGVIPRSICLWLKERKVVIIELIP